MAEKWHSGITMHKLSFGGGFMGLLFAAGSALIFVMGFPTLWYFVALAAVLGIAIAVFLTAMSNWRSERNKPLSILTGTDEVRRPPTAQNEHHHLLRHWPGTAPA